MSSIRSTVAVLNQGLQSFVKGTGSVLGGASSWISDYFEIENEVRAKTVVIDIQQRFKTRIIEYKEFEDAIMAKHNEDGIARINELQTAFENLAIKRAEANK